MSVAPCVDIIASAGGGVTCRSAAVVADGMAGAA